MKNWGLRILSALLTFTLGLYATTIVKFHFAPEAELQPVHVNAAIKGQLPSPVIAELAQPSAEIMHPHAVEISPYEIKRLIDGNNLDARRQRELDLTLIWKQLGIVTENTGSLNSSKCKGSCEANILTLELDGQPGMEILLVVGVNRNFEYRYLIFKEDNSQRGAATCWVLLGYVDA